MSRLNIITKRLHFEVEKLEKRKTEYERTQNRNKNKNASIKDINNNGTNDSQIDDINNSNNGTNDGILNDSTNNIGDENSQSIININNNTNNNVNNDINTKLQKEFESFRDEQEFKIRIVKQRLVRHEQLSIKKMNELNEYLQNDPRVNPY